MLVRGRGSTMTGGLGAACSFDEKVRNRKVPTNNNPIIAARVLIPLRFLCGVCGFAIGGVLAAITGAEVLAVVRALAAIDLFGVLVVVVRVGNAGAAVADVAVVDGWALVEPNPRWQSR